MAGRYPTSACNRFVEKCQWHPNGCLEWTAGTTKKGYGKFGFGGKAGKMRLAHRWLYEQANGVVPPQLDVCHRCDNPRCVNIEHLFVGTRKQNMEDAVAKGRTSHVPRAKGEEHGMSKLTADGVKQARLLRQQGRTLAYIAKQSGISIAQAHRVVTNKSWKE